MKRNIALINGIIYSEYDIFRDKALLISGPTIRGIVDISDIPDGYEQVDVGGSHICPGLIDLQIYGSGESLFSAELTIDSLHKIECHLLEQGCTSFYLTLATNTLEVFRRAMAVFEEAAPKVAMGLHLEGPFLNAAKRGAHPQELIVEPQVSVLEELFAEHGDAVKMMTIAPENVSEACVRFLLERGVLLSAGHSNATREEAMAAFDTGVRAVTHLWNAMSPLHHRNVGVPGATFLHPSVCASIIVDGIHVDFEAVKLSKQLLRERLFLITDAVASCNKGIYKHVLNGDHYVLPDGTLSGSALTLLKAVENCVSRVDIALDEALRMATLYPADLIGRKDIGRLAEGTVANVLVFSSTFEVESVYFMGEKIR